MMNSYRHIISLILLSLLMLIAGCEDKSEPSPLLDGDNGDANVTLTLNVSIANSSAGTRAAENNFTFDPTEDPYELINTLRVIIVRADNTVECNRLISAPNKETPNKETPNKEIGVNMMGELEFKVSTTEGTVNGYERTEKKRIYLIANESSIAPNPGGRDLVTYLSDLKAGYYKAVDTSGSAEDLKDLTEEEKWAIKWKRKIYVKGDSFAPPTAEGLIIYNEWPNGSDGSSPDYAVPYIDNAGAEKKFVPMTEFFDIEVTENLNSGLNVKKQVENLFITRNLVKFQFSINASPITAPFRVTGIKFSSLMQEEYLFPNKTIYDPRKDDPAEDNNRQIIEFSTPGFDGKNLCPYVFRPENLEFTGEKVSYSPMLYFCESKVLKQTSDNKPFFEIEMDVEYLSIMENVEDKDGNIVTRPVTNHFVAKTPLNNLPYFIPRNTIVDVNMTLTDGELSAVATVLPYTAVSLNPEFGFSRPETDKLTVAPTMELKLDNVADLYPNFTSSEGNTISNVYWVSSNPDVVLLGNHVDDDHSQIYKEPADAVDLPYYHYYNSEDDYEIEPVRIFPQGVGTAYVTAYTQSGLVARCLVTVKE